MNVSIELYAKLDEYLDGRCHLRDLEGWLAPRLALHLSVPGSDIGEVASTIELCIAEITAGIRTERSAKVFLRRYMKKRLKDTGQRVLYIVYPATESDGPQSFGETTSVTYRL